MMKNILQAAGLIGIVGMAIYDWRSVPIAVVGGLLLWDWWRHRPLPAMKAESEKVSQ